MTSQGLIDATHRRIEIREPEDVGALRRSAASLAAACPGVREADVALAATELATNLVVHAGGGFVLVARVPGGIELLAVDRGPGLRSAPSGAARSAGGASVAAPLGTGLGIGLAVVRRLASDVDAYSNHGEGTVVLARFLSARPPERWWRAAAVNVSVEPGSDSGDLAALREDDGLAALLVDGLGHGPEAAAAARAARAAFDRAPLGDLGSFIGRAHEAMRATRGGVLGVCRVDGERDELSYVGVGNVSCQIVRGSECERLLARDGSLGTHLPAPRAQVTTRAWAPGSSLVLASDGLRSGLDPRLYPGLLRHDPAVVAAVLYRDFGRTSDDACVLVVEDLRTVRR